MAETELIKSYTRDLMEYLASLRPLSHKLRQYIEQVQHFQKAIKGQTLLAADVTATQAWYVGKGMVKAYYYNEKSDAEVIRFWHTGEPLIPAESFYGQEPCSYYIETLEESNLLFITRQQLQELLNLFPEAREFTIPLLLQDQRKFMTRSRMLHMTAEERYLFFCETFPYYGSIPLHDIASYLGIAYETLIAIRSRLSR